MTREITSHMWSSRSYSIFNLHSHKSCVLRNNLDGTIQDGEWCTLFSFTSKAHWNCSFTKSDNGVSVIMIDKCRNPVLFSSQPWRWHRGAIKAYSTKLSQLSTCIEVPQAWAASWDKIQLSTISRLTNHDQFLQLRLMRKCFECDIFITYVFQSYDTFIVLLSGVSEVIT